MLKKSRKLSRGDLSNFKDPGVIMRSGPLIAKVSLTNKDKTSKFSFSVSKKVDKRAVYRNKIKRKLFLVLEERLAMIKPGAVVRFSLGKSITSLDNLEKDVVEILKLSKLI